MLRYTIDEEHGIVTVTPEGDIVATDYRELTDAIDRYNAAHPALSKVMILTEHFPHWDTFASFFQHLKFIREQRSTVRKVAAVTDAGFLSIMPQFVDHFVKAEIRHFAYGDRQLAEEWLQS